MTPFTLALAAVYVPLCGLAAYRFARFLAKDALIERTRQRLLDRTFTGGRLDGDPLPVMTGDGYVAKRRTLLRWKAVYLAFCGFCNGFWLAGLFVGAVTWASPLSAPLVIDLVHWAGAAGLASILIRWDNGQTVEVADVTPPRPALTAA